MRAWMLYWNITKAGVKKGLKLLFAGNLQTIKIDKMNAPAPLNNGLFEQQTFFSTREQAFLISSAARVPL